MRHTPAIIAFAALAAAVAVHGKGGPAPDASSGLPAWALFSFAVAAFRGPVR